MADGPSSSTQKKIKIVEMWMMNYCVMPRLYMDR
jgi:hypothetical protein